MQSKITLAEAARLSPGHPSTNAVWRWCRKGVLTRAGRRVRLCHLRVGGRIFVDPDDLHRFFREVAEADNEYFDRIPPPVPSAAVNPVGDHTKEIQQAERALADAGV